MTTAIGFIGAGQMAKALAAGFVRAGLVAPQAIVASDPYPAARDSFLSTIPGATCTAASTALAKQSDIIFLAVKPQAMSTAMNELRQHGTQGKLFVSIAAGVTLAALEAGLGTGRVIRVMPNTPALIGQGASAFCRGSGATPDDAKQVSSLLSAVGKAIELEERHLDAVTGLSGSGPAFVYVVIEALSDAGVRVGLPRDVATTLAAQTVLGSAQMVLAGEHPAVLKDRVASPGGTTIAGLEALEQNGLRGALYAAVVAATNRARELGAK
jgi:pyrroline-5-carboxylate reductase